MKFSKTIKPKNTWPICSSLEGDMTLRSDFWQMGYQNERIVQSDNTDINRPTPTG